MSLLLYNLSLSLYKFGARFISPWNPKAALWLRGRKNLMKELARAMADRGPGKLIWMHCASLGEFEQGRPVLEALREKYPSCQLLVTFYSPSGYEIRKNYPGADWIFYLPTDSAHNASAFVDLVRPELVIWVKYEYWYHFLTLLHKRNIPVLLVSGIFRKDQVFFKWYGSLHRKMLKTFRHLFVQDTASVNLLNTLKEVPPVTISGDTRFDRVAAIAAAFRPIEEVAAFCRDYPVIVAGSTWETDEEEMDHYANTNPGIRFIIAPHEIDEVHLKNTEKLFKKTVRLSRWKELQKSQQPAPNGSQANVLIVDNIGMLARLYHYATIAYVGGGFGNDGIHNLLEATAHGKPVLFGPVFDKFREARELLECGGAFTVSNALELEDTFNRLISDGNAYSEACKAALDYTMDNRGATAAVVDYINRNQLL